MAHHTKDRKPKIHLETKSRKNLNDDKWNELIAKTDTERNNKDFWLSIKRMIRKSTSSEMRYLRGHNNEEVYEDEGKENIFRKNLKKYFKFLKNKTLLLTGTMIDLLRIPFNKTTKYLIHYH